MEIRPTQSIPGIERTAAAIQRGQADFDKRAEEVTRSVESTPPEAERELPGTPKTPTVDAPAPDTATAAVAFREQALVNQVLYQTFRAQADQQLAAVKDLTKDIPGA